MVLEYNSSTIKLPLSTPSTRVRTRVHVRVYLYYSGARRTADAKEVIGGGCWDGSGGEHKTGVIGGGLDGCGEHASRGGRGAREFLSFLVYLPLRCVGLLLWHAT